MRKSGWINFLNLPSLNKMHTSALQLTQNQQRVMVLLKKSLCGTSMDESIFQDVKPYDWSEILEFSAIQGVFALVYDGLSGLSEMYRPPREILIQWELGVSKIEVRYDRQKERLRLLTGILYENGIKCMILKGIGISKLYPIPKHRECGDLDIWLFGDYDKGNRLMEESGIEVSYDSEKHSNFFFEGTPVENHQSFLNIKNGGSDAMLEPILRQLLEKDKLLTLCDSKTFIPPISFSLLFLFKHAVNHFLASGIVLRHLCDWALLLQQCTESEYQIFYETIRQHQLDKYAGIINTLALDMLGLSQTKNLTTTDHFLTQKVWMAILKQQRINHEVIKRNLIQTILGKLNSARFLYQNRWKYSVINKNLWKSEYRMRIVNNANILFKKKPSNHV